MSSINTESTKTLKRGPELVTAICPDGSTFDYYSLDEYTTLDHLDIYAAGCSDEGN